MKIGVLEYLNIFVIITAIYFFIRTIIRKRRGVKEKDYKFSLVFFPLLSLACLIYLLSLDIEKYHTILQIITGVLLIICSILFMKYFEGSENQEKETKALDGQADEERERDDQ